MLEYLRIQGLGLVDDISLEFGTGINAITGETGAGKSFILKAVSFVLGEKTTSDAVRPGCEKARVEALFTRRAKGREEEVVIRRELSAATGRSRFWLNGAMATQDEIKALRPVLSFHVSQHGQQKLLQPAFQTALLDSFMKNPEVAAEKDALLKALKACSAQKKELLEKMDVLSRQRDFLEMQQKEIDKVAPEEGEEEKLLALSECLRNDEKKRERYDAGLELLLGGEGVGLLHALAELDRILDMLADGDDGFASSLDCLRNFEEEAKELASRFRRSPETKDGIDPEEVEQRLFALSQLKRRLHRQIPEILALRKEIEDNLSFLDACGLDRHRLEKQERELARKLFDVLANCNMQRQNAAEQFCRSLEEKLQGLGFSDKLRLVAKPEKIEVWPEVKDSVKTICPACIELRHRLLWAPNPGQPAQPLDKIASGGELSRFMLAVVCAQNMEESDPVLIFDEIDAGIGGTTLNRVAERIRELAGHRQVMIITHWPRLAEGADQHFLVSKEVDGDMTFTTCSLLNEQERKLELERMEGREPGAASEVRQS